MKLKKKEIFKNINPEETHNFITGDTIASFKFRDINGVEWKSEDLRGKIIVIYFCIFESPATRYEAGELNAMADGFKDRPDVVCIAITDEDKRTAKNFIKKNGFRFHVIPDAKAVLNRYDVHSWPTHLVIDKKGKVRLHTMTYNPELSVFWVKQAIEEASAHQ